MGSSSSSSMLRAVYDVNAYGSFVLGLAGNLILLFLILRHTPTEMRRYSRILLQTCSTDIASLVLLTLFQMVSIVNDDGVGLSVLVGPLFSQIASQGWIFTVFYVGCIFYFINVQQFGVQYFYRWHVLTKNRELSLINYTLLLVVLPVILAAGDTFLTADPSVAQPEPMTPWIAEALQIPMNKPAIQSNGSLIVQIMYWIIIGWIVLLIASIIVFGWKTSKFVSDNLKGPRAERDRSLQRQLNNALIIQATVAIVVSYVPGLVTMLIFMLPDGSFLTPSPTAGLWMAVMFEAITTWPPAINPFITVAIIKPYRKALKKLLFRATITPFSSSSSAVVQPIQMQVMTAENIRNNTTGGMVSRSAESLFHTRTTIAWEN